MLANTPRVNDVGLLQLLLNACMLGDVPIGQMHLWKEGFGLFIDTPPDDPHLRRITKTPALALYLVLLVRSMKEIVARPTHSAQWLLRRQHAAYQRQSLKTHPACIHCCHRGVG